MKHSNTVILVSYSIQILSCQSPTQQRLLNALKTMKLGYIDNFISISMSGRITDILLLQLDIRSGIKCISKQKLEHDYLYYLSIFKVDKKRLEKYIKNASSRFNYLTKYLNKFIISGNKLPQNVSCLSQELKQNKLFL